jgi:hypothetical protein
MSTAVSSSRVFDDASLRKHMRVFDATAATPAFLTMTVTARLRTLQTTLKLPRQVVSDKKWEGESWMGARKRVHAGVANAEDAVFDAAEMAPCTDGEHGRPPRPPSPSPSTSSLDDDMDDTDDESATTSAAMSKSKQGVKCNGARRRRKKDKDVVPSRTHWVWDEAAAAWTRAERPRLHAAGIFFSFAMLPPKHIDLLRALLADSRCPLTEHFLRTELVPRLNREHAVSLRALDWLMVDYACENNVAYMWPDATGVLRVVNVHDKYARLLKCWRRRRFDCFRRRHRIYFELDGKIFSTTVAQLHFFFVAHTYGFLEFTRQHLKQIDAHMKETLTRNQQAKRAQTGNPKRQALVHKAKPCMLVSSVPSVMSFAFPDMA